MGAVTDLAIIEGADYSQDFALTVESTGAIINLTPVDLGPHVIEVRKDFFDKAGGAAITTGTFTVVAPSTNGIVRIVFTNAQTALITDPTWRFEARLNESGRKWQAISGSFSSMKRRVAT